MKFIWESLDQNKKQLDKLLDYDKGKLTFVLTCGFVREALIGNIIEENKDKKILVFGRDKNYLPCPRLTMFYGMDIKEAFKTFAYDCDIFIVDCFLDSKYNEEIEEFIRFLKWNETAKNKAIILFFEQMTDEVEKKYRMVDAFPYSKPLVINYADYVYALSGFPTEEDTNCVRLYNLKEDEETFLKMDWDMPYIRYKKISQ